MGSLHIGNGHIFNRMQYISNGQIFSHIQIRLTQMARLRDPIIKHHTEPYHVNRTAMFSISHLSISSSAHPPLSFSPSRLHPIAAFVAIDHEVPNKIGEEASAGSRWCGGSSWTAPLFSSFPAASHYRCSQGIRDMWLPPGSAYHLM